jgi:hypothetical protein
MSRFLTWERVKDPQELIDYSINWANQLATAETITLSTWAYSGDPDNTPLLLSSPTISGSVTTIWMNNGTNDTKYTITNTIDTSGGRKMEQSVYLRMRTR